MHKQNVIEFKRGDTFETEGQLLSNGSPLDITGYQIKSHIRYKNNLVKNLAVSFTDAALGKYKLSAASSDTASWPISDLDMDIEFTDLSGKVTSTNTIIVRVISDITQ
jgi:hypothetical protein